MPPIPFIIYFFVMLITLPLLYLVFKGFFNYIKKIKEIKKILKNDTVTHTMFFQENKQYLSDKNNYLLVNDDNVDVSVKSIFFGVFILGIGSLVYYNVSSSFGIIISIFIVLFSIVVIIGTTFIVINNNKYGKVPLNLYNKSTVLGEKLRGYISINVPIENAQFIIVLQNVRYYRSQDKENFNYMQYGTYSSDSGNATSILWSKTVKGYINNQPSGMEVHFNIDIPKSARQTSKVTNRKKGYNCWILTIKEQSTLLFRLKRIYTINITKAGNT